MIRPTPEYAGLLLRALAILLDTAVLSALFLPVTKVLKGTWVMSASDHQWSRGWLVTDPLCIVFLVVMFLYFVVFEAVVGATPGKRLLRLRVVRADGSPAGFKGAIIRNLLRVVDSLPALGFLGAVLIASSSERTRFGDRAAGTRVIRAR